MNSQMPSEAMMRKGVVAGLISTVVISGTQITPSRLATEKMRADLVGRGS